LIGPREGPSTAFGLDLLSISNRLSCGVAVHPLHEQPRPRSTLVLPVFLAAALVCLLLLVTFDLDRPTRGLIKIPATPLTSLRASMELPPAAAAPSKP